MTASGVCFAPAPLSVEESLAWVCVRPVDGERVAGSGLDSCSVVVIDGGAATARGTFAGLQVGSDAVHSPEALPTHPPLFAVTSPVGHPSLAAWTQDGID